MPSSKRQLASARDAVARAQTQTTATTATPRAPLPLRIASIGEASIAHWACARHAWAWLRAAGCIPGTDEARGGSIVGVVLMLALASSAAAQAPPQDALPGSGVAQAGAGLHL